MHSIQQVFCDMQPDIDNLTRDNYLDFISKVVQHPTVLESHLEWERKDAEWKELIKSKAPDGDILSAASILRTARKHKDDIADAAAILLYESSEKMDLIEPFNEDILGHATKVGEVEELSIDWHNLRRKGIGGSSLSEALGFHWKSRPGYPVYLDSSELDAYWEHMSIEKSTPVKSAFEPTSGVLFRGHMVEPALIARYAIRHNARVGVSKATWKGPHPYQIINTDGLVLDSSGDPEGLLECKTSSREWTWQWGVPLHYRAQVLWYLYATGLEYAHVLVKFDTGTFDEFTIEAGETVDGTQRTGTIEDYLPDLNKRWKKLLRLKKDPTQLWDTNKSLKEEERNIEEFINSDEDYVIVHSEFAVPYERMDSSFTKMTTVCIDGTSYSLSGISPIFYDVDHMPSLPKIDLHAITDKIGDKTVLAVDRDTLHAMKDLLGSEHPMVLMSGWRRLNEGLPGLKDFTDYRECTRWIEENSIL